MIRRSWEYFMPATPEALWPFVADTERFNRLIGNPPVTYREQPDARGGTVRFGAFRFLGVPLEWRELPYEWREPEEWSIRRRYLRGPFSEFFLRMRLRPDGEGTRLAFDLELIPRRAYLAPLVAMIARMVEGKSRRFAERMQGWLAGRYPAVFVEPVPSASPALRERLASLSADLVARGFPENLVARLVDTVCAASEADLLRMRPYALADAWGEDRRELLRLCLHATRLGLLEMTWDLICPLCRGAKERHTALSDLSGKVHCSSCQIDFQTDFDDSVELTFRPAPAIRRVEALNYCIGGPGNTPHVALQRIVAERSTETLPLPYESGAYRLRSPQTSGMTIVELGAEGPDEADLPLDPDQNWPPFMAMRMGGALRVRNRADHDVTVLLERVAWADHVVRASLVTAMPEFRDLFSAQILAPGVEMGISRLTFLFTDLRSSTALYARMGDGPAFALVQEHFRILERAVKAHGGSVVKTIGDAVMAVFPDAGDGVRAGLAIQQAIAAFNATSSRPPIVVKVGAHVGPTIAVRLNHRLDYFGTTVNVAARVQNESHGADLVLSEAMLADPGVRQVLSEAGLRGAPFAVRLKGLEGPFTLHRFELGGWQAERVVEALAPGLGDAQLGASQDQQERAQ